MRPIAVAPLFAHLVHADWSKHAAGRWMARASFVDGHWNASGPLPVGPLGVFVEGLSAGKQSGSLLAGFDFPIGLPIRYAERTKFSCFRQALSAFGSSNWPDFFAVAETPRQIGLRRPFYPLRPGPKGTVGHAQLLEAHDVIAMRDLARRCENRPKGGGRAASPMFWTLGAASVGKAAIHGWQEVIRPAIEVGAKLWPFDGDLALLSSQSPTTLAETYPGDAYGQVGLPLIGWSKTRLSDRQEMSKRLRTWAAGHACVLAPDLDRALRQGFTAEHGNDNGFDAVAGLFGMIAIAHGRRSDGAPHDDDIRRWEGWILGRAS